MIVTANNAESAAFSLYNECERDLPLTDCKILTNYVDGLDSELPMGMSMRRYEKRLIKQTRRYAKSQGMRVGSGILAFFFPSLIQFAISLLIKHFLSNKGWV